MDITTGVRTCDGTRVDGGGGGGDACERSGVQIKQVLVHRL